MSDSSRIDLRNVSRLISDTPLSGDRTDLFMPSQPRRTRPNRPHAAMLMAVLALAACAGPLGAQAGAPRLQKHESRHEIDQIEETWREAMLKSNTAVMDGLLADDYMAITASGTLQTKEQALASMRVGRMHFTALDISDRKVRFYGQTAVVTSLAVMQGTTGEGEVSGSYRYTRVYVRNVQGEWKIVSFEVSRIREPGEHSDHK